jgi:hypothetical protein
MAYSDIKDPSAYFQNISWTGNSGTQTVATTGNSDLDPDIVFTFSRSDASNNKCWFDTSRGNQKILVLQGNDIEGTSTGYAFDFPAGGDGIDLDGNWGHMNYSGETYRGHLWKVNGGTTSSNTDGDVTSTVQVNTTAGISIVTWSATDTTPRNIGHGLGVKPDYIIIRNRTRLETTRNCFLTAKGPGGVAYNEEYPYNTTTTALCTGATTSTFGVGTDFSVNGNYSYIALCKVNIQGFSKYGLFKGNGSADGRFVYTGFKPAMVIIKSIETGTSWMLMSSDGDPYNVVSTRQKINDTSAEATNINIMDFLSNGFKMRVNDSSFNTNGHEYVYEAYAENPFVAGGIPTTAR